MFSTPPLLVSTLQGQVAPRPPLWLMRQAGRYLPEYRAVRQKFPDFLEFCLTPDAATEVTLQPLRRFPLDAAIIFADILTIPDALGFPVHFTPGYGPVVAKITTPQQVAQLAERLPELTEKLAPIATTITQVRGALQSPEFAGAATIGFSGAPFTLACYLLDEKPSQGIPNLIAFQQQFPAEFSQLIETLTQACLAYLTMQAKAGAQVLQVFDSWAGSCPTALWEMAVHQPLLTIHQALGQSHPGVPVILFPRLATPAQLQALAQAAGPASGLSLSTEVDLAWAVATLAPHVTLQGNLDPALMVLDDPQPLAQAVQKIRQTMHGHPHSFNLGHGLTPETQIARVAQLTELVRA